MTLSIDLYAVTSQSIILNIFRKVLVKVIKMSFTLTLVSFNPRDEYLDLFVMILGSKERKKDLETKTDQFYFLLYIFGYGTVSRHLFDL